MGGKKAKKWGRIRGRKKLLCSQKYMWQKRSEDEMVLGSAVSNYRLSIAISKIRRALERGEMFVEGFLKVVFCS